MREQYIEGIPYISKEQFYKMAHIRKSTALKLIRTGTVPAIDTGENNKSLSDPTVRCGILFAG